MAKSLSNDKAPELDNIHNRILKFAIYVNPKKCKIFFNKLFKNTYYPITRKIVNSILLPK